MNQLKNMGDRLQAVEQSHIQLEQALQQNAKTVQDFIGDNELEEKWNKYLEDLQEDANDATEEGKEQEDN